MSATARQSFNDCAVFALANATGRPYGVVAALATKFMKDGQWRAEADRLNPQNAIERKNGGLIGGEVILLAEAFGRAEIISSKNFEKTLNDGRPIMISVTPDNKRRHEIVLAKTFQHGGETWYEAIDSNWGPFRKLYLSHRELDTILLENGVAFSPEPGTTPKLLR